MPRRNKKPRPERINPWTKLPKQRPKTRALGPPPDLRPNYYNMNEGQKRYAWEQYNLARVRRGLPVDHPHPDDANADDPGQQYRNTLPGDTDDREYPIFSAPSPEPGPNDNDVLAPDTDDEEISPTQPDFEVPESPPAETDENFDHLFDEDIDFGGAQSDLFSGGESPFRVDIPDMSESPMEADSSAAESSAPPAAKKRKAGAGAKLPGTGQAQGGGGLGGPSARNEVIPRPFTSGHHHYRNYKKVHRFISFGLAYKPILEPIASTPPYNNVYMVTPMAEIPWERLFMYMNQSEYNLLPLGSRVVECSIKVISENVRIAFPTNASTTNLATLNQNKFLRIGKGLRQSTMGVNVTPITFQTDQPMITTAITPDNGSRLQYDDYVKAFYGSRNNVTGFATETPVHQFGIPYPLKFYYAMVTQDTDPTASGWPTFQQYIEEIEADGAAGNPICAMTYKPKMGLIKPSLNTIYTGVPKKTAINVLTHTGSTVPQSSKLTIDNAGFSARDEGVIPLKAVNSTNMALTGIIEKSYRLIPGILPNDYVSQTQPSCHVGLQPVIALTTKVIGNDAIDSYTDAQAYFEVECECTVETAFPTYRPHATAANVAPSDVVFGLDTAVSSDYGGSMLFGQYQTTATT